MLRRHASKRITLASPSSSEPKPTANVAKSKALIGSTVFREREHFLVAAVQTFTFTVAEVSLSSKPSEYRD